MVAAKTAVLAVEDSRTDYEALQAFFETQAAPFELTLFDPKQDPQLRAFKVSHPEQQIVIVDLVLDWMPDEPFAGLTVIREHLWPADRAMFFVVFTRHSASNVPRSLESVEPLWCVVQKQYDEHNRLTNECLDRLLHVLLELREYCPPHFSVPHHDSHPYATLINSLRSFGVRDKDVETLVQSLTDSVRFLQEASNAAAPYTRLGRLTANLGAGVFGSVGRFEMRPTSDIELAVLILGKHEEWPNLRKTAVEVWNRLAHLVSSLGRSFEGRALIEANTPSILLNDQVTGDIGPGYNPVIDAGRLIEGDTNRFPHLRHKHCQLLLELRPIFNKDLITELKRQLVVTQVGMPHPRLNDIIDHPYLGKILKQFLVDVTAASLTTNKDRKTLVFRTLHVLATRLALIELREEQGTRDLRTKEDWEGLFDQLMAPGAAKIVNAYKWLHGKSAAEDDLSMMKNLIRQYVEALIPLMDQDYDDKGPANVRPSARLALGAFREVFVMLQRYAPMVAKASKWLFEDDGLETQLDWIR